MDKNVTNAQCRNCQDERWIECDASHGMPGGVGYPCADCNQDGKATHREPINWEKVIAGWRAQLSALAARCETLEQEKASAAWNTRPTPAPVAITDGMIDAAAKIFYGADWWTSHSVFDRRELKQHIAIMRRVLTAALAPAGVEVTP